MIIAVADDFTGAAEIGGIGLRYGMKVEIATEAREDGMADLLVIATNIRSKTAEEARVKINRLFSRIGQMKVSPQLIYKKTDSVLRGHILVELMEQMKVLDREKALLLPANPQFGRVIMDGTYYIDGKKLEETDFRNDPEFAVTTSDVGSILRREIQADLRFSKPEAELPKEGIVVGEASSDNDLKAWAGKVKDSLTVAGASGFFAALLEEQGFSLTQRGMSGQFDKEGKKMLFVCGSTYSGSRQLIDKAISAGGAVSLMPEGLMAANSDKQKLLMQWVSDICLRFNNNNYVIISANPKKYYDLKGQTEMLRSSTGAAVKKVVEILELDELLLEGGSTAFSVIKELGLKQLFPVSELSYGVIRMALAGYKNLYMTLKPGSYEWPSSLWPVEREAENK